MKWEYREYTGNEGRLKNEEAVWFFISPVMFRSVLKRYMKHGDSCDVYNQFGILVSVLTYEDVVADGIDL